MIERRELENLLTSIALQYPPELHNYALQDVQRTAFHIGLFYPQKGAHTVVCDVGGSISLFSVGCAALGMRALMVDKFVTQWPIRMKVFSTVHQRYQVELIECDVISEPLKLPPASLDVAASFDSIEHWHGSPKPVLHALKAALRPNGMFVLGLPNCVNLRKRLTVPFGYGRWCSVQDWYEAPMFRSHVHEPDVGELTYIARDLQLSKVRVIGRNWLGYSNRNRLIRQGTRLVDHLLRLRPSLCSDIYLIGQI